MIHASRQCFPLGTLSAGAFNEVSDFEIESMFVMTIIFWMQYQFHFYFIWLTSYIHILIQAFKGNSAQQDATSIH